MVTDINIQFLKKRSPNEEPDTFLPSSEPIKPKPTQIHLLIQFHPIKFSFPLASLFCHETISRKRTMISPSRGKNILPLYAGVWSVG